MESPAIDDTLEAILRRLDLAPGHLLVSGPEGSGRTTLARALSEARPNITTISLPALTEPDAPAAALLLGVAAAGGGEIQVTDEKGRPTSALETLFEKHEKPIVVRIPGAIPRLDPVDDAGATVHRRNRVIEALRALTHFPYVVWIVDGGLDLREFGIFGERFWLRPHEVSLDAKDWGALEAAAARLLKRSGGRARATPVVWRLGVGAVHLGAPPDEIAAYCRRPTPEALHPLTEMLAPRLRHPSIQAPMQRLLLARRPLDRDLLCEAVELSGDWKDLAARVVGYGNPLRVNPQVRRRLSDALPRLPLPQREASHHTLARLHEKDDGVDDPKTAGSQAVAAWVERIHHLGASGERGQEEWTRLEKPWPELYWERGRYLSAERHRYAEAARVYEACLDRFPDDDYAHHYLAWNLEKAGTGSPEDTRAHYARAVELSPDNPWWSSRRITNLIRQKRWIEARRCWRRAIRDVDPDGERTRREPWLPGHLHRWVAQAWMEAGAWYEARYILEGLPDEPGEGWRARLRQQIEASAREERRAFGEELERLSVAPLGSRAANLWAEIEALVTGLPVPALAPGEDGPAMTWSHPGVLLEIEVEPAGGICWAACDHVTGESDWGETAEDTLGEHLEDWLQRVRHG